MLSLIGAIKTMSPAETLVVDAPFGRLDTKHVKSIIKYLPNLAPQIILFLTDREYKVFKNKDIASTIWHIQRAGEGSTMERIK